jgi:hypothetical protein
MNEAEAERRLAEIQRGRWPHSLQSETQLQDLELRLKQTAVWCAEHVADAIKESLRPPRISPHPLAADRWAAVDDVVRTRAGDVRSEDFANKRFPPGRLLVYFPDADLCDGAAEVASAGFFDGHNAPPWGCWVGYFADRGQDPGYSSYLLAWVPAPLESVASAGIAVNPEARIAWLDDVDVALRSIMAHAQEWHAG